MTTIGLRGAPFGTLPASPALTEASPDSLSELFSRDPLQYTEQDIDQIIGELRKQRERLAAAQGPDGKPVKPIKQAKAPAGPTLLDAETAAELGL